jgi:cardiolipin synthase (CMP-forming)
MYLPNILTLLRIFLVPVIIILLIQSSFLYALIVFMIAGITDGMDGFLARVLNQKTIVGAYLDPLADKALILSSFITLSVIGIIPSWLTVIVISRDCMILVGISILSLMEVPFEIKPVFVSKVTTTFQLLVVFGALVFKSYSPGFDLQSYHLTEALYMLTALLTIVSGLHYIVIGVKVINHAPSGYEN